MSNRTRTFLILACGAASALCAEARAVAQSSAPLEQALRVRVGGFRPEGDSRYWHDKARDFTGAAADLEDAIGGVDYRLEVTPHLALLFSGSTYEGTTDQSYRGFVDARGNEISHRTTLEIDSLTAGVVFHLTGSDAAIRPYVGAGGGLYTWRLEESGRFLDFTPPPPTVFRADSESDGEAFGHYFLAGFEVPIGHRFGFFAEGRWQRVEDDLDRDFENFGKIDLSGRDVSAGVAFRF